MGDLELSVVSAPSPDRGFVAAFAITDQVIVALGGAGDPFVAASSNVQHFAIRRSPRAQGLRDALALADQVWACGEYGQLAVTRDHGDTWTRLATGTDSCLFSLALGTDGALWVVGDHGYVARVLGDRPQRIDFGTTDRHSAVFAVRDDIVALGFDGKLRRWRDGKATTINTGATRPLTWLTVSPKGTWLVVGDGGFVARSPDGQWFSRVAVTTDADLEAIHAMGDGTLVVVGARGTILISSDEGRTWKPYEHTLGDVHLWSIERFGGGILIGGDGGLIVKLAPPGDATWAGRIDLFAGEAKLDAVFAPGPGAFIANGLAVYLDAIAKDLPKDEDED